ncbi:DUF4180 domain-containing protein, partial [Alkalimonas collagenimarina]
CQRTTMKTRLLSDTKTAILEPIGAVSSLQDALDFVSSGYGYNSNKILLRAEQLPPEFFELQTCFAGEFIQKLVNYRFYIAGVFGEVEVFSESFREYVGEARRGRQFRSFATEDEAILWLETQ